MQHRCLIRICLTEMSRFLLIQSLPLPPSLPDVSPRRPLVAPAGAEHGPSGAPVAAPVGAQPHARRLAARAAGRLPDAAAAPGHRPRPHSGARDAAAAPTTAPAGAPLPAVLPSCTAKACSASVLVWAGPLNAGPSCAGPVYGNPQSLPASVAASLPSPRGSAPHTAMWCQSRQLHQPPGYQPAPSPRLLRAAGQAICCRPGAGSDSRRARGSSRLWSSRRAGGGRWRSCLPGRPQAAGLSR